MVSTWLRVLDRFTGLVPSVEKAPKSIRFTRKCMYTFLALLAYLLASQVPLFGLQARTGSDPLYWFRAIMASQRGSLMELGISPSMTTSLLIKVMVSAKVLPLDRSNQKEMDAFARVQNLLGAIFTFLQACLYVFLGMYGPVSQLGVFSSLGLVAQLTAGSIIVQMLDQMLENGWGVGSGMSLFTTVNVCENIMWRSFSFISVTSGDEKRYEGAVVAAIHYLFTRRNKLEALRLAFFRSDLPNLMNLAATLVVFAVCVYLQSVRRELPLQHARGGPSMRQQYPIKLLYAGSTPLMLISSITSTLFMISQALWRRFGNSFLLYPLGIWREDETHPGQVAPVAGLVWALAPPYSLLSALYHPLHTIIHVTLMVFLSGYISKMWVDFSGEGAKEQAEMLETQGWIMPGFNQKGAMQRELNRYIPVASVTGGVLMSLLSLAADLFGALGSGTGILIASTTMSKVYEEFAKESLNLLK